jgi:hypothetical protein
VRSLARAAGSLSALARGLLSTLALLLALGATPLRAFAPAAAVAQALDPQAAQALAATLKVLLDPAMRSAAVAGNPQASQIDQQIRALTGSEALTQEFYALAADVFSELTQGSGGDPGKMTEALSRASADPSGLATTLSPQTLERLRQLAAKISDRPR